MFSTSSKPSGTHQFAQQGPNRFLGGSFDEIGFSAIPERLFRDMVIARLVYPTSKVKTVDYLYRHQGKTVFPDSIYLFRDRETYPFFVAARIRNETAAMQEEILRQCLNLSDGQFVVFENKGE